MQYTFAYIWKTKKVHLQFDRSKFDLLEHYIFNLHMYSLIIEEQIKMDDF